MAEIIDDALEFFNTLSGTLHIELTEPAQQAAPHLLNLVASPTARIKDASMELHVYSADDERELTEEEWRRVVLRAPRIRMRSIDTDDVVIEHDAPDGATFTVRDLAAAIAKTERTAARRANGSAAWTCTMSSSRASSSRTACGRSAGARDRVVSTSACRELLKRLAGSNEGAEVLALWRRFAWTRTGAPKRNFELTAASIVQAEAEVIEAIVRQPSSG